MLLRTLCMRTPVTNEFKAADSVKQTPLLSVEDLNCCVSETENILISLCEWLYICDSVVVLQLFRAG